MSNLVAFSVRNVPFTLVAFGLVVALGVQAFRAIPRAEDPTFPLASYLVIAVYPGASPTDVERLVAEPLEDAVAELDDLDETRTTISDGLAVLRVEFDARVDADDTYDEMLREVNGVRDELPDGLLSLEVRQLNPGDTNILQVALTSETAPYHVLAAAAEALEDRLERAPGVKEAQTWAYPEREVRVGVDLERLAQFGVAPTRLLGALQSDNANVPGGALDAGARAFNVRTNGGYESLDQIRQTVVAADGARVVRVGDVAEVGWAYEAERYTGRYDGRRAVFVTANQREGASIFETRAAVEAVLADFDGALPGGVAMASGFDQAASVARRVDRLSKDFLIAIALVLLTLLPLGLRAAGVVAVSIPLSLLGGLTVLYYTGYTINQLSIVGFVLALGLLVDDSIVVVENITRWLRTGVPRGEAAIRGTKQITVAVLGSTATLVLAFVPMLALPGTAGDYIRSLPLAVVYSVLASLVVSLTIIPFLASRLLPRDSNPKGNRLLQLLDRAIHAAYRPVLRRALVRPRTALAVAAGIAVAGLALLPAVGFGLFPKADANQFLVRVETPDGASLAETDRVMRTVEATLRARPEVAHVFANVGRANPQIYYNLPATAEGPNIGEAFVELAAYDPDTTPALLDELRAEFDAVPGARITLVEFENGPPVEAPVAIRIVGPDLDTLRAAAGRLERLIASTPGTRDVVNPVRRLRTDLAVDVDPLKAGLYGVPTVDVDRAVRLAVAGVETGTFREADGDEVPIVARLPMAGPRPSVDALDRIYVASVQGAQIPLAQVSTRALEASPTVVQRFDRERSVTVLAGVERGANTGAVTAAVRAGLGGLALPAGYRTVVAGEAEAQAESFGGLGGAIAVAVFGILAVLVLQFKTFQATLIVASVIPLGAAGGVAALFLFGYSLSFMAAIGFIALVGIEIKASLLLVDFTNELRAEGVGLAEAVERAGEVRFLPVVLTAATAIGGMVPLILERSDLYSPLAVVIVGGLISSTLLARIVTPVMYKLLAPPVELAAGYPGGDVTSGDGAAPESAAAAATLAPA